MTKDNFHGVLKGREGMSGQVMVILALSIILMIYLLYLSLDPVYQAGANFYSLFLAVFLALVSIHKISKKEWMDVTFLWKHNPLSTKWQIVLIVMSLVVLSYIHPPALPMPNETTATVAASLNQRVYSGILGVIESLTWFLIFIFTFILFLNFVYALNGDNKILLFIVLIAIMSMIDAEYLLRIDKYPVEKALPILFGVVLYFAESLPDYFRIDCGDYLKKPRTYQKEYAMKNANKFFAVMICALLISAWFMGAFIAHWHKQNYERICETNGIQNCSWYRMRVGYFAAVSSLASLTAGTVLPHIIPHFINNFNANLR